MNLLNAEVAVNVVFSPQKLFLSGLASDHCPRYRTVSVMKDNLPSSLSGLAVGAQHFQSLLSLPVEVSKLEWSHPYCRETLVRM